MITFFQFSLVNNHTYRFHQNRYQSTDFGRLNSYEKKKKKKLEQKEEKEEIRAKSQQVDATGYTCKELT
ncbi:hypothetical protein [Methanosarcina lacustris]|uniref:hypothetical protein n=1 Tax=Methanosarcina lacustris TaxID=170861 RepID=UPI00064ED3A8|nr:hypothetical protein [Methanosarcina lacustris]